MHAHKKYFCNFMENAIKRVQGLAFGVLVMMLLGMPRAHVRVSWFKSWSYSQFQLPADTNPNMV